MPKGQEEEELPWLLPEYSTAVLGSSNDQATGPCEEEEESPFPAARPLGRTRWLSYTDTGPCEIAQKQVIVDSHPVTVEHLDGLRCFLNLLYVKRLNHYIHSRLVQRQLRAGPGASEAWPGWHGRHLKFL